MLLFRSFESPKNKNAVSRRVFIICRRYNDRVFGGLRSGSSFATAAVKVNTINCPF